MELCSRISDYTLSIQCLILPRITKDLPRATVKSDWPHIKGLRLADPYYFQPGPVDILLGAEYSARIKLTGVIHGDLNTPSAENTHFGWMLSGSVSQPSAPPTIQAHVASHHVHCHVATPCVSSLLERFWTLEEASVEQAILSKTDQEVEDHYLSTHTRNPDGSFMVELPFKTIHPPLGSSRGSAVKRFNRLESRLSHTPQIKEDYVRAMREQLSSGFMELVPHQDLLKAPHESFYLPHREVVKE